MKARPHLPHKKGFSLIEAAIVLGIIGLVIGGIWVAAAAVNRKHKIGQLIDGIYITADNAHKLFKGQAYASTDITQTLITAGAIPPYLIVNGLMKSPGGFDMAVTINGSSIAFYIYGLYGEECRSFATAMAPRLLNSKDFITNNSYLEINDHAVGPTSTVDQWLALCPDEAEDQTYLRLPLF